MVWIPLGAWLGALLVAAVVLGFCAYEILWKTKRLRADVARLQTSAQALTELSGALAATGERLAATGLAGPGAPSGSADRPGARSATGGRG